MTNEAQKDRIYFMWCGGALALVGGVAAIGCACLALIEQRPLFWVPAAVGGGISAAFALVARHMNKSANRPGECNAGQATLSQHRLGL
jgi:hypothetical protein